MPHSSARFARRIAVRVVFCSSMAAGTTPRAIGLRRLRRRRGRRGRGVRRRGTTAEGDGCSPTCQREDQRRPAAATARSDAGEACDDSGTAAGDGCSAACEIEVPPRCGDGALDPGEQCDDGNVATGDGCEIDCTKTPAEETVCESFRRSRRDVRGGRRRGRDADPGRRAGPGQGVPGRAGARGRAGRDRVRRLRLRGGGRDGDHVPDRRRLPGAHQHARSHHVHAEQPALPRPRSAMSTATTGAPATTSTRGSTRPARRAGADPLGRAPLPDGRRDLDRSARGARQGSSGTSDRADQEGLGQKAVHFDTFPLDDTGGREIVSGLRLLGRHATGEDVEGEDAYCPHVAEGIEASARNEFVCLRTEPERRARAAERVHPLDRPDRARLRGDGGGGHGAHLVSPLQHHALRRHRRGHRRRPPRGADRARHRLDRDRLDEPPAGARCAAALNETYYDGFFTDRAGGGWSPGAPPRSPRRTT